MGKKKLSKEDNQLCWDLSRAFLEAKLKTVDQTKINDKSFCTKCNKIFCLGYDCVDVYCDECYYKDCCQKEMKHRRLCQKCEK